MIWVGFAWASIIDPLNGPAILEKIPEFLNHWDTDASIDQRVLQQIFDTRIRERTKNEKIRFCILILYF